MPCTSSSLVGSYQKWNLPHMGFTDFTTAKRKISMNNTSKDDGFHFSRERIKWNKIPFSTTNQEDNGDLATLKCWFIGLIQYYEKEYVKRGLRTPSFISP